MAPSGLKAYKDGLKSPTHDRGIPENPDVPDRPFFWPGRFLKTSRIFLEKYYKKRVIQMAMQIEIQKDASERLSKASKAIGVTKEEIVQRALCHYLDALRKDEERNF